MISPTMTSWPGLRPPSSRQPGAPFYSNKLHQWFPNPTDGHNGYNFKRYDTNNNFPATSNLFVAVAYVAKTNDVFNTTNRMWFTIWDAAGQKVVTNKIDTAIPHITDIIDISNRLFQLKTNLNANPNALDRNYALDTLSSLVGECHKTWRDGWLRCFAGYGCAARDYAFAARSGRLGTNALNSAYLQQCETEILARGTNVRTWSTNNAYGTSLDPYSKYIYNKGWFFGGEQAFDLAVADKIQSDPGNIPAIVENLNYEAGRNPLNVSRLTGLGWYRQREVVHQFAQNNRLAVLPPSGIPLGNIASFFDIPIGSSAWHYGYLDPLCVPPIVSGSPDKTSFALYDRWAETYNIHTEFVHLQTARGLAAAAYLVTSPSLRTQIWSSGSATITFPNGLPSLNSSNVAQLSSTQDLSQAQILWDPGRLLGQEPAFGTNFTFVPATVGDSRTIQAEAVLPDGRRIFAVTNFSIWDPVGGDIEFTNDANTVALYHLNATNNNLFLDATTNHYDLTIYGRVDLATNATWMRSPTGSVARFFNAGGYLFASIPSAQILPTNGAQLTIEARIYPRAYKGDGQNIISLWGTYSAPNYSQFALYYQAGMSPDAPRVWANCCPMLDNSTWSQYVSLNTWHQLKITFDSSGVTKGYIDGTLRASTNNPVQYNVPNPWQLTLGNFDGDIDEVRISNIVRP